jgi:hypothetical protein
VTFVLTPLAARDLEDIWNYLAKDNLRAADRVLDAIEGAIIGSPNGPASVTSEKTLLIDGTGSSSFIPISSSIGLRLNPCRSFACCTRRETSNHF